MLQKEPGTARWAPSLNLSSSVVPSHAQTISRTLEATLQHPLMAVVINIPGFTSGNDRKWVCTHLESSRIDHPDREITWRLICVQDMVF
jgi:hypothetical protein